MRRIWQYNPGMKLIVLLRNPIDRAFSHWTMEASRGKEAEDFRYAIENEISRCRKNLPFQHRVYSYCDRGFYSEQIRRMRRFFPDSNIMFVKYEEFRQNQAQVVAQVEGFLGVEPEVRNLSIEKVHESQYTRKLAEFERKYLVDIFINDIKEVERLLSWDCSDWV